MSPIRAAKINLTDLRVFPKDFIRFQYESGIQKLPVVFTVENIVSLYFGISLVDTTSLSEFRRIYKPQTWKISLLVVAKYPIRRVDSPVFYHNRRLWLYIDVFYKRVQRSEKERMPITTRHY